MVEGESDPAPVNIVETFDLLERLWRHSSEIAASCIVRPEPRSGTGVVRARPDEICRHWLRRRCATDLLPRVGQVQVDLELLAREVAQIGVAVELIEPVVTDDAFIAVVVAAEEVPNCVGPTMEGQADTNRMPCRERRAKAARFVVLDEVEVLNPVVGVPVVNALIELIRTWAPVSAGAQFRPPCRSPRCALFRYDLNDSAGRLGAVKCLGRRTFEDLDRFDIVRVDVVESRWGVTATGESDAVRSRGIIGANSVDKN